jgi:hypothetical protein
LRVFPGVRWPQGGPDHSVPASVLQGRRRADRAPPAPPAVRRPSHPGAQRTCPNKSATPGLALRRRATTSSPGRYSLDCSVDPASGSASRVSRRSRRSSTPGVSALTAKTLAIASQRARRGLVAAAARW